MNAPELDYSIGDVHRAFIDTSTCIANLSTTETAHQVARHLFSLADAADPLVAYISTVSVAEMLVRPIRRGDSSLDYVTDFLRDFPNLHILNVNVGVANQAANIRAVA